MQVWLILVSHRHLSTPIKWPLGDWQFPSEWIAEVPHRSLLPYNSISFISKSSTSGTSSCRNGWASFIYLSLWASNGRQQRKKRIVDSALEPHMQILLSVSVNSCLNLFAFRVLNPILSWYENLRSSLCVFKTPFSGDIIIPSKIVLEVDSFSVWRRTCLKSFQLIITASGWNDLFEPQISKTHLVQRITVRVAEMVPPQKRNWIKCIIVMREYALSHKNYKTSVSKVGAPNLSPLNFD